MNLRSPTPWLLGGIFTLATVGIVFGIRQSGGLLCAPRIQPGGRILFVGDSLAVGLKTPLASLATQNSCDFLAFAESGTTMSRWLGDSQVAAAIQSFNPTLTIVCLGTNDSKGNTPDAKLAEQVAALRDRLTSGGSKLVWVLPPKLPFPERVGAAVAKAGVDSFPSSTLPIPQPDGIHTTGRGYAGWAEHIWAFLSCTTSTTALSGLGAAPRRPSVPAFMTRARPPKAKSAHAKATKKRRRV